MKPLTVPKKYNRTGLKVFCSKCNRQVSERCGLSKKKIDSCQFTSSQKYKAIVHIPLSDYGRRTRLMKSINIEDAVKEMAMYKQELKETHYQPIRAVVNKKSSNLLIELCQDYIDFLECIDIPEHLKRNRTKMHTKDIARVLLRLNTALKKEGYNLNTLKIEMLGDNEVGIFHNYLLKTISLGKSTYNRHIGIVVGFYRWLDKHKGLKLHNPFARVELNQVKTVTKIITNQEFHQLLAVINKENGLKKGESEKRTRYKEYLKDAYKLALETGCRREELAILKWCDIVELEQNVEVLKINNLKVNRIMTGENEGNFIRYVPITRSLKLLLLSLGYDNMKGKDEYILSRPSNIELMYFMDTLSRGFSHYFNLISDRGLNFKDLRKTYITKMTEKLGSNAKLFTGHTNDEVLKGHYLAGEYLAAKLNDVELFIN